MTPFLKAHKITNKIFSTTLFQFESILQTKNKLTYIVNELLLKRRFIIKSTSTATATSRVIESKQLIDVAKSKGHKQKAFQTDDIEIRYDCT